MTRIAFVANTDWYLFNYRQRLARALIEQAIELVLMSPAGPYVDQLRRLGFHWEPLEFSRHGSRPMIEAASLKRWVSAYRRVKPDLVHHFTVKPVIYGSLAGSWAGVPCVVNSLTGMGFPFSSQSHRPLQWFMLGLFRTALSRGRMWTVFQNSADLDFFTRHRMVSRERSLLIPGSGVDMDRFSPHPEPGPPITVLMASRMLTTKGVWEMVEAARICRRELGSIRMILVGRPDPGNPVSIPESTLSAWVNEGVVEWWGHRDDMPEVYAQAHMVVLPSYREGLPKSLLEAGAMQRPVIATDAQGCRDVVYNEQSGILVPPRDAAALARAILRLAGDPELRERMGRAGRARVLREFSDDVIIRQTLELYGRALPGFGHAPHHMAR